MARALLILGLLLAPCVRGQEATKELFTICTMRIIVDQYIMKDMNIDSELMKYKVKEHLTVLNEIYKKNVEVRGRQLKFRVKDGDLKIRDEAWCNKNPSSVSCEPKIYWNDKEEVEFLTEQLAEAKTSNNDVCMVFFFISHKFKSKSSSAIGLAYVGQICQPAHMGYVLFNEGTTDKKRQNGIETKFVFAHEVGHLLGLHHDGGTANQSVPFSVIGSECNATGNLMAPKSSTMFNEGNTEFSDCSKKMFVELKKQV
jgi:hypothetical protein